MSRKMNKGKCRRYKWTKGRICERGCVKSISATTEIVIARIPHATLGAGSVTWQPKRSGARRSQSLTINAFWGRDCFAALAMTALFGHFCVFSHNLERVAGLTRFAFLCVILTISAIPLSAQQQRISNVQASFNKEKSEITVSCYLRSTIERDLLLSYSIDNGRTWTPCLSVVGDIKRQTTGTKTFVWQPVHDGVIIGEFLFKVSDNSIKLRNPIEMVFVSGGTFTMGCTSEQGKDCYSNEKPAHEVTLSDYYIGKYEVTQAQWVEIMGDNPSEFAGCDNCPVERVSWEEVQEFILKLNSITGEDYRLPTEAEWEYAARGGNQSGKYKYSGSNRAGEVAWYSDNSGSKTHPVGQKKSNELGIYDMNGNVWEWCQDWYEDYRSRSQMNPKGASSGSNRVYRGGSWSNSAEYVRVSFRIYYAPGYRNYNFGFRLACSSMEIKN